MERKLGHIGHGRLVVAGYGRFELSPERVEFRIGLGGATLTQYRQKTTQHEQHRDAEKLKVGSQSDHQLFPAVPLLRVNGVQSTDFSRAFFERRSKNASASIGRTKSPASSTGFGKAINPNRVWRNYFLDDQLADSALRRQVYYFFPRVIEETAYFTAIVGIDDAGQNVNSLLCGQTGSRGEAPVVAIRYGDRKAGPDQSAFLRLQTNCFD
jgi:hypothetical protein